MSQEAIAVFRSPEIEGEVVATDTKKGVHIRARFTHLPSGKHGFHIHKAGDLRGEGCQGLCEHYDVGKHTHGGPPGSKKERHTGDLGNVEMTNGPCVYTYTVPHLSVKELWGRSVIIHEDEDDLGQGPHEDSKVTGHAGRRIGCAIFGRAMCPKKTAHTRYSKTQKKHH
jgi:Cu-Zn family superoxide dismutase